MPGGPQPITHEQRLQNAMEISSQLFNHYGDQIVALGIYGSLAREMDGPYSDIEMHCILKGSGVEKSFEWSSGAWKAEVDIYSPDVALQQAAAVYGDWPFTHGSYVHVKPIHDPESFFPVLREAVLSHPTEVFRQAIQEVIVGEVYEIIGKIRNAGIKNQTTNLAHYADKAAVWGACLIGLDHRHLYTSFVTLFDESLALSGHPDGYDALCQMVIRGSLSDPQQIVRGIEQFWEGLEGWAAERRLPIEHQFGELLIMETESAT